MIREKTVFWVFFLIAVLLTTTVALSFYIHYLETGHHVRDLAHASAQRILDLDITLRRWATGHGGIYVPITEKTPPNPNLSYVPERDITTPSGRKLTLLNPAHLVRQMHELEDDASEMSVHITSLNPIRPQNAPEPWETDALRQFELGRELFSEIADIDGSMFYRLMYPMISEAPCLKCHAEQGYSAGDVLGGVSVSLNIENFVAAGKAHVRMSAWSHGIYWLLGLGFVGGTFVFIRRRIIEDRRNLEALEASEDRFQTLFNNAPLCYQSMDERGILVDVNSTWLEFFGYEPEEVIGHNFTEFFAEECRENFKDIFHVSNKTDEVHDIEYVMLKKDGTSANLLFHGKVSRDGGGGGFRAHCIFQDVTENRQVEEARRVLEEQNRLLLNSVGEGIFGLDRQGRITFVNPMASKLLGYDTRELLGVRSHGLIHHTPAAEDDQDESNCPICAAMILGEGTSGNEEVFIKKGGAAFPVAFTSNPIIGEDSHVVRGTVVTFQDITERKRKEREINLLAAVVDQASESIVITDTDGNIQYVNPAFEAVTGYAREEVLGQTPRILKSGRQSRGFYRDLWKTISSGKIWRGYLVNLKKDGSKFEEKATIFPVRDDNGQIVSYVGIKRDLSREKALEAQLHQTQKMEAIGLLAGGVAHDFNNLLMVIMGQSEIIKEDLPTDSALHNGLDEVIEASERAAALTHQLLAFSRKQKLQPKFVSLKEIVNGTEKMMHRLIGEDIALSYKSSCDDCMTFVDAGQIEQVLMNLCINARDAMPHGGRIVVNTREVILDDEYSVDHGRKIPPGDYVMLSVEDSGIGMDKTTVARIFEPFFTTKEQGRGTGLGLSTAYGIVKQSGGYIWVYSEPGIGTTFKIYFPQSTDTETSDKNNITIADDLPRGSETVLLVEDEDGVRKMLYERLQSLGYNVIVAAHPEEALTIARESRETIRLLLTDVVMPKMSGPALAIELSRILPEIKILYISGYVGEQLERYGLLDEDICLLEKPFSKRDLANKMREVLN